MGNNKDSMNNEITTNTSGGKQYYSKSIKGAVYFTRIYKVNKTP